MCTPATPPGCGPAACSIPDVRLQRVYRVAVVVPCGHVDTLLAGVRRDAALVLDEYGDWAWLSAPGEEQFRPLPGATPARGTVGEIERVPSRRVEFCIAHDEAGLSRLLAAIRAHHPWQVPAITVDEPARPLW